MAYYKCTNIYDLPQKDLIEESIEGFKCPDCDSYLMLQKYEDSVMKGYFKPKLSCKVNDFFLYKCPNVNCGNIFLEANIKGLMGLVK